MIVVDIVVTSSPTGRWMATARHYDESVGLHLPGPIGHAVDDGPVEAAKKARTDLLRQVEGGYPWTPTTTTEGTNV